MKSILISLPTHSVKLYVSLGMARIEINHQECRKWVRNLLVTTFFAAHVFYTNQRQSAYLPTTSTFKLQLKSFHSGFSGSTNLPDLSDLTDLKLNL